LAQVGARVISIDKAPLAPEVARLPGIEHRKRERLRPRPARGRAGRLAVLGCRVAIRRGLLGLVERWLDAGTCRRFVCTIKFQGETDHATAARFAAIPGSQLRHLFHNKHELTWIKLE